MRAINHELAPCYEHSVYFSTVETFANEAAFNRLISHECMWIISLTITIACCSVAHCSCTVCEPCKWQYCMLHQADCGYVSCDTQASRSNKIRRCLAKWCTPSFGLCEEDKLGTTSQKLVSSYCMNSTRE